MRRAGGLWHAVADFGALLRAAHRAGRGQRTTAAVARFFDRLEPECLALERSLRAGTFIPGAVHRFVIRDPKERTITAVPFRDRVVHHALIAPLEPVFERRMISTSFACRRGKGTHRAIRCAQGFLRRHGAFLKLDVASFFASVVHGEVRRTLGRIVKDRRVLELVDVILRGPPDPAPPIRGLPIGSLTSQWFANLLLDRLDHFVKEELRIPGYVRYMDDFVLFDGDRGRLREARCHVEEFLRAELRLRLKDRATILAPAQEGLPFLGFHIHRGTIRVRAGSLRRYRWRLRHRRWELARGRIDPDAYRAAVRAVIAHLSHADTVALRRRWFGDHGLEL